MVIDALIYWWCVGSGLFTVCLMVHQLIKDAHPINGEPNTRRKEVRR